MPGGLSHLAPMPPLPTLRSSGDLIADRRYAYAKGAFDENDFAAAADLAQQVLELAPDFAPAHALLGHARAALGEADAAITAFRAALALEPDDALGMRIELAHLGVVAPETAITDGYVRELFDDYAPRFDRHLIKTLSYRGPEMIVDALRRAATKRVRAPRFMRVFDLGCGTGFMGRALAGAFDTIEGVDLSPRMLARAARTRLYARLHEGELTAFLKTSPASEADLVVAADVFVYMAVLGEVFREACRVLRRGGFFAFTVQAHAGEGVILGPDARYAHGENHLRELAAQAGFTIVAFERVSTREDRGEPVPGFLVVLEA